MTASILAEKEMRRIEERTQRTLSDAQGKPPPPRRGLMGIPSITDKVMSQVEWLQHHKVEQGRKPSSDDTIWREVRDAVAEDVKTATPIQPFAFAPTLLRQLSDEDKDHLGLVATGHRDHLSPPRVLSALMTWEQGASAIRRACRFPSQLQFIARAHLLSLLPKSTFRFRHGSCLDGVILARHWRSLPASSRELFGTHVDEAINHLEHISPDGQAKFDRYETNGVPMADFASALLLPDGELVKFLRSKRDEH